MPAEERDGMKASGTHKVLLVLAFCLTVFLLCAPAGAADVVASGECGAEGSSVSWTLDSAGLLTISGTGAMEDYTYSRVPWEEYRTAVKTAVIESGVTNVGGRAFSGCKSLTGIVLPEGVVQIGDYAFSYCESLTEITLPGSVERIGSGAFSRCKNMRSVTVSKGLSSVGDSAFSYCESLDSVYITNINAWCHIEFGSTEANPMYQAKNIYLNGEKIFSVTVPEDVKSLKYTFMGFRELIRVTLPDGLTEIGDSAFSKCSSLTSVTIPESVEKIGDDAFLYCTSLVDIVIPEHVTSIGARAFCGCGGLTFIIIPEGVVSIGKEAFFGCGSLTGITLPSGLTSISNSMFTNCHALTGITIPDSVTSIGNSAFGHCENLEAISIPESVIDIGEWAFYYCTGLTTITIPQSVQIIDYGAFNCCESLASVTILDGAQDIGEVAFGHCYSLTDITIPASVKRIESCAFYECNNLTNLYFSDIGAWCRINFGSDNANPMYYAKNIYLNGAKMETLEVPEGIQAILRYAFVNAASIRQAALPQSLVGVAANAFSGCSGLARVYYAGSQSDWGALNISAGNEPLTQAERFYGSTIDRYVCRITVTPCDGGRIYADRSTAEAGDTVTITATPFAGYTLDAICVDGAPIDGNQFTVTGNHTVTAVFTLLPVVGGTPEYRLEGIGVTTQAGEKLQELKGETLLVSISVKCVEENTPATVMLAQYDEKGRYQGLLWLTLEKMPAGGEVKVTIPLDNSGGKIANLKAFVVSSVTSFIPVGNAVSFGSV